MSILAASVHKPCPSGCSEGRSGSDRARTTVSGWHTAATVQGSAHLISVSPRSLASETPLSMVWSVLLSENAQASRIPGAEQAR